jgi:hypothetical protein
MEQNLIRSVQFINSMECSPWKDDGMLSQEISCPLWNPKFYSMFRRACHWSLFWAKWMQSASRQWYWRKQVSAWVWEKPQKHLVEIASNLANIWTKYLPITSLSITTKPTCSKQFQECKRKEVRYTSYTALLLYAAGAVLLLGSVAMVLRLFLLGRTVTSLALWCMSWGMWLASGMSTHVQTVITMSRSCGRT